MNERAQEKQLISPGPREGEQILPVNVFDAGHDLVVVAPMPGMEPENIHVDVAGNILTLKATLRGPGQRDRHYIQHEWTYGPYLRRLELPGPVDAEHANASFGNGVLTLTLPKAQTARGQRIEMQKTGTSEGHREGHSGHSKAIQVQPRPEHSKPPVM